ncbi:MAG: 3-hydroxybutyryl-CoA dehydrogenase [Acidimicrobiales bacterium]
MPAAPDIDRVGVVGGGQMGSGIAEVHARAGLDVIVHDVDLAALDRSQTRITRSLDKAVHAGKLTASERDETLRHIRFSTDLGEQADRQLVIEAIVESEDAKVDMFAALDKVVAAEDAILASNTSSIPIMKLGMATNRPGSVIGIHFFNPVPLMKLVELVPSLLTTADTEARAEAFAVETLGKHVIHSKDRAGFVVNALLIPYLLSAVRMLESGFATADDIDAGMVQGCNHPMGPLALIDLIGLDTTMAVAESMYEEFKEPLYAPPPLLSRMVHAGLLGRKAGRGFFLYDRSGPT